jgi:hypothetical protein
VTGFVPATSEDEKTIVWACMKMEDKMLISADDATGGKLLMVTGIPSPYAGFSFPTGMSLPQQVYYNVVVIRVAGTTKILSTYPAGQTYIDGVPGTKYVI